MQKIPHKPSKPKKPKRTPITITLPPRNYQPSKAEKEQTVDMPGASLKTVASAFFQPVKVKVKAVKKGMKPKK